MKFRDLRVEGAASLLIQPRLIVKQIKQVPMEVKTKMRRLVNVYGWVNMADRWTRASDEEKRPS